MKKILICGDVNSGKSTLIGRLLKDSKDNLYKDIDKDKLYHITDTLSSEQKENKTIHSSQYYLDEDILLINCPGHKEYIKDTISRMSEADVAILIQNKDTKNSELTSLYAEMLEMFRIPYIRIHNVIDGDYSLTEQVCSFTLDVVNDNIEFLIKETLNVTGRYQTFITSRVNTIIFDKFNYVKISGKNDKLKIKLDKLVYSNDIIKRYESDICMSSGSKIVFYNNKKLVGCGIFL